MAGLSAKSTPLVRQTPTDRSFDCGIVATMETHLGSVGAPDSKRIEASRYPVDVSIEPQLENRNRLTTAFRPILAIPHLLLVGGPIAFTTVWLSADDSGFNVGAGAGALGAVAGVCAIIAWFAIVFGASHPQDLWKLAAFFMRWRVRAVAYFTLLHDEYPPFGDGDYPVALRLDPPDTPRDRLSVALRPILAIPHFIALWVLGIAWVLATIVAWFSIVIFGSYPEPFYRFATGVLRWETRVEAYVLLLRDEYPPFSLE